MTRIGRCWAGSFSGVGSARAVSGDLVSAIELRHLDAFLAVAEEMHFGRAAERLHITQPPLTRRIQQLEEELGGVRLFDRTSRRLSLTDAGQVFLPDVRRVLDQLARALEYARRVARGEAGRLRLGFISTVDYTVLPALLKAFRARSPDTDVQLLEATGDEQLRLLEEGSLDVGILIPQGDTPRLRSMRLYEESLVAVLSRGSRVAGRRGVLPVKALREERFVLFPRRLGPALYDTILGATGRAGFAPRVVQEARQMQTIIGLVAGGLGVSIVPASMQSLRRRDVVYKRLTPAPPPVTTHVMWSHSSPSPAMKAFLGVCRQIHRLSPSSGL